MLTSTTTPTTTHAQSGRQPKYRSKPRQGKMKLPLPTTAPILTAYSNSPRGHGILYADENDPGSRAKPRSAGQLQLFAAVTRGHHARVEDARFSGAFSRNPIVIEFNYEHRAVHKDLCVTYLARWAAVSGPAVGPWSEPLTLPILIDDPQE
ncbi:MAG: hypothetical protein ACR2GY_08065 [Phycisphaerales bacterium]